jgi:hypothetical protein
MREGRSLRVFENGLCKRIFGAKRDKVKGEWRKLCNEKLNNLYTAPNIVRVIKSRRMGWTRHVARMVRGNAGRGFRCGDMRQKTCWADLWEIDRWEDPGINGRIYYGRSSGSGM